MVWIILILDAENFFEKIESDYKYMSQNLLKRKGSDKEVYCNYIKDSKKLIFGPEEDGEDMPEEKIETLYTPPKKTKKTLEDRQK